MLLGPPREDASSHWLPSHGLAQGNGLGSPPLPVMSEPHCSAQLHSPGCALFSASVLTGRWRGLVVEFDAYHSNPTFSGGAPWVYMSENFSIYKEIAFSRFLKGPGPQSQVVMAEVGICPCVCRLSPLPGAFFFYSLPSCSYESAWKIVSLLPQEEP